MEISREDFVVIGKNIEQSQVLVRPSMTYFQDAWRRLKYNKAALLALVFLVLLTVMAVFGPMMYSYSYSDQDLSMVDKAPGIGGHIFGTDSLGRDLFVRIWVGARISLFIGIAGAVIEFFIGIVYGGIAGYLGGYADEVMMRIVDILFTIPNLVIVILLIMVMGPGLHTIIIAIALTNWLGMARLVRGQTLQLREQEFVLAARTLGADGKRIIMKHLIPNTIGPIIVRLTFAIPGAIFTEAFLSFIGLGVPAPLASWGSLAAAGQRTLTTSPWQTFFPALFISLAMLSFNIIGDGLRDALDPRLRK
ncbi:ABC transporter permease [Lutispora saccharofermentans]|uniref:ABC transporter permease n=1 Tax=Lutispora saccharofermentans TaxID=3024236 RepID=A0ABT1NGM2_9FIRM|nr:ABC transporter permease [Lutispora saccharofermentans]MCQ1530383.1 ABC transporter permease [Lutispora saccharofermentans]